MVGYSFIVYNLISDSQHGCLYIPDTGTANREEIQKIFNFARAGWKNGLVVCCIEGDWRDMDVEEISVKCCQNIREELKW